MLVTGAYVLGRRADSMMFDSYLIAYVSIIPRHLSEAILDVERFIKNMLSGLN